MEKGIKVEVLNDYREGFIYEREVESERGSEQLTRSASNLTTIARQSKILFIFVIVHFNVEVDIDDIGFRLFINSI